MLVETAGGGAVVRQTARVKLFVSATARKPPVWRKLIGIPGGLCTVKPSNLHFIGITVALGAHNTLG